ncbi:hypothetical protein DSECCO2_258650 [anaerobic digester metagenome]
MSDIRVLLPLVRQADKLNGKFRQEQLLPGTGKQQLIFKLPLRQNHFGKGPARQRLLRQDLRKVVRVAVGVKN